MKNLFFIDLIGFLIYNITYVCAFYSRTENLFC